jgi:hypothetical protein
VAVSDDGMVGAAVCDECKTNDLSLAGASRRQLSHRRTTSFSPH